MGFIYIRLLRSGYRPGQWMYSIGSRLESSVTPKGDGKQVRNRGSRIIPMQSRQERIDELLDKINQKGYKSLSQEERDFLSGAGKN